jgi:hypothetical protein
VRENERVLRAAEAAEQGMRALDGGEWRSGEQDEEAMELPPAAGCEQPARARAGECRGGDDDGAEEADTAGEQQQGDSAGIARREQSISGELPPAAGCAGQVEREADRAGAGGVPPTAERARQVKWPGAKGPRRRRRRELQLESSDEELTEDMIGQTIEVLYQGDWYTGTLAGLARDDMRCNGKWRVQAECDAIGMWTYSDRIRRPMTGRRAIGTNEQGDTKGTDEGKGRTRRLRKVRAVEVKATAKRTAVETEELDHEGEEASSKKSKSAPMDNSGMEGPTTAGDPRRFSG